MAKKNIQQRSFADALTWLRSHGFEVQDAAASTALLKKNGCAARLATDSAGFARLVSAPGILLGGEISSLVDKGYQKVLKTPKLEVAATAGHLKALHDFAEELREGLGATSLYNEALGTVSDRYMYDRVAGRDNATHTPRPWETTNK